MAKRRPAGFSLVELLVVITIIGMLVALLLPAVQAAREAARRAACSNNLHQIGLGLQNYHSVHASFPPGCIQPAFMISNGRQFAWSALLLPYIEQQPLSTAIDFSQPCYAAVNAAAAATVLPTYMCPSTRAARRGCRVGRLRTTAASTAKTSPHIRPDGSPKTG